MNDISPSRGTLVAIGAAAHMNFLYRLVADSAPPFGQLVLLEPDPAAGPQLAALFAETLPPEIIAATLGPAEGEGELLHYNFPGLTSLHPAENALQTLFPGLRVTSRTAIRIQDATALMERLETAPRPLSVVINLPGSELDILQALHDAGATDDIDQVRVRCAAEPMFAGGSAAPAITQWLAGHHLTLYGTDDSDPDWPELRFAADHTARNLAKLQKKQVEMARQLQEKTDQLAESQTRLAEQETALTEARDQLQEAQTGAERAETLQADLGLALRLQAMAQSDLEDLREKYRESQAIQARQEDLLQQLTPRLQQAAQQLRLLAPEAPEPIPEPLSEPVSEPATEAETETLAEPPAPKRRPSGRSKSGRRRG